MSEIYAWPVVRRADIVRAAAPGTVADREPPFRALRAKGCASAGVALPRRRDGRLAGQLVVYSSLNVDAARWARIGQLEAARTMVAAAERVEAGESFAALRDALRGLDESQQDDVLDGRLPDGPVGADIHRTLCEVVVEVAAASAAFPRLHDGFAGRVTDVMSDSVIVTAPEGARSAVPLWLVRSVGRDKVGDRVVVLSVRLDERQALVQVVPGIETSVRPAVHDEPLAFTPFGRGDRRVTTLTGDDIAALRGAPQPLTVLVPVFVEG